MAQVRRGPGQAQLEVGRLEGEEARVGGGEQRGVGGAFPQVVVLVAGGSVGAGQRRVGDRAVRAFAAAAVPAQEQRPGQVSGEELVGSAFVGAVVGAGVLGGGDVLVDPAAGGPGGEVLGGDGGPFGLGAEGGRGAVGDGAARGGGLEHAAVGDRLGRGDLAAVLVDRRDHLPAAGIGQDAAAEWLGGKEEGGAGGGTEGVFGDEPVAIGRVDGKGGLLEGGYRDAARADVGIGDEWSALGPGEGVFGGDDVGVIERLRDVVDVVAGAGAVGVDLGREASVAGGNPRGPDLAEQRRPGGGCQP